MTAPNTSPTTDFASPTPEPTLGRPAMGERLTVAVVGGLLAGTLAFVLVYLILRWEVKTEGVGLNRRYSTRDALWMGLLAAGLSFFLVCCTVYMLSVKQLTKRLFVAKWTNALLGLVLAGYLGLLIGFWTVREEKSYDEWLRSYPHWVAPSEFDIFNETKAMLAGWGTGVGSGIFSGMSLYLLLDRRDPPLANQSKSSSKNHGAE